MSSLFPELDGDDERRPEDEQDPEDCDRPLVRLNLGPDTQGWRGGRFTHQKFRQLLGLPQPTASGDEPRITRAEVMLGDGRIELTIEGAEIESMTLRLVPCKPSRRNPTNFRVMLAGPVTSEAVQHLIELAARRLHRVPFRILLKVFRLDKERKDFTVYAQDVDRWSEEQFDRSVVRTHGGRDAWRIFHAELEQQRNFNHRLMGSILVVRHEDLECCYATPPLEDGTISFINYSAAHLHVPERAAFESEPDEQERPADEALAHWGEVATDLDDDDVVKGGTHKVEQILDAVAARQHKPDIVMVKTACVPKVIGDDLSQAMRSFEERTGVQTVFLDNLADEENDFFSTVLDRLRLAPEFKEPEQTTGRVNLVGFPTVPSMNRLVRMLERLGVIINARLVPEVRFEDMKRYPWAQLQVLFDTKLYYPTFEQLFGNVDMPSLRTTPPFGVRGSRAWLEEVATALGCEQGLDAVWDEQWGPFEETWEQLTERALMHQLGFVIDQRSMTVLLQPNQGTGVPMLEVLQEMGFTLEFLYYGGDDTEPDPSLPGSCQVFQDAAELEQLLRASEADAFYSEYYFDRRLTRCGKAQFSVSNFKLGFEGAIDTLTQLLQICAMCFYRRYAAYLGKPFDLPERGHGRADEPSEQEQT